MIFRKIRGSSTAYEWLTACAIDRSQSERIGRITTRWATSAAGSVAVTVAFSVTFAVAVSGTLMACMMAHLGPAVWANGPGAGLAIRAAIGRSRSSAESAGSEPRAVTAAPEQALSLIH